MNGCVLLVPVTVLSGGGLQGADVFAVAALSLAVAAEVMCATVPPPRSNGDLDGLNWAQGLVLLAGFELELLWQRPASGLILCIAGCLTILAGGLLRSLAIQKLGGGFTNTSLPGTSALCVDGIYAWLRHPAEAGVLLIAAGFPIATGAWLAMTLVLPLLLVLSVLRVRREERGLADAFPGSFDDYRRRVRL